MTDGTQEFTPSEIKYLESLPAVERVSHNRIRYTEAFKRDCMRRYAMGESPSRIFRNAGLDSKLIGYKRIERAISRWHRNMVKESERSRAEHDRGRRPGRPRPSGASVHPTVACTDEKGHVHVIPIPDVLPISTTWPNDAVRAADKEGAMATGETFGVTSNDDQSDPAEDVQSAQLRRIAVLERKIECLRSHIDSLEARLDSLAVK